MPVHVLPGDSLVEMFGKIGLEGDVVVCRECFIDGDLKAESLEEFWQIREEFLRNSYGDKESGYTKNVTDEFIRLWNLSDGNKVNLWFERELFCQVNLWFCLWILRNTEPEFFAVYPKIKSGDDRWTGFSALSEEDLKESFEMRVKISNDDVFLGAELWEAFQARDFEKLLELGDAESEAFPTLKEVCEAAAEIDTRPKETLRKIIEEGKSDFRVAFQEFCKAEAIYGFGDLQVKKIYDTLTS